MRFRARVPPEAIVITDPGPGPDHVKAVVIAAILHRRKQWRLLAIVCNGGHQALERARLVLCLLDHLQVRDVPVGVGSPGAPHQPRAYEYALDGYDTVDARRASSRSLLVDRLAEAGHKNVTVIVLSNPRDLADAMAARPDLLEAKVAGVVMRGSTRRADDGALVPEVCLTFSPDMEAASTVLRFCEARQLPVRLATDEVVPAVPMRLVRSFAVRAPCSIMRYLAEGQNASLEGLWQDVCRGDLPAGFDRAWYFATFCGVPREAFATRPRPGPRDDILPHLEGTVRPFAVVALLLGVPGFEVRGEGSLHADAITNMLRDAYHAVVEVTMPASSPSSLSSAAAAAGAAAASGRRSRALPDLHITDVVAQPPPAQGREMHVASPVVVLRDEHGVMPVRTAQAILEEAVLQARSRVATTSSPLCMLGILMFVAILAALVVDNIVHPGPQASAAEAQNVRFRVYGLLASVAGLLLILSIHPVESFRPALIVLGSLSVAVHGAIAGLYLAVWPAQERVLYGAYAQTGGRAYEAFVMSPYVGAAYAGALAVAAAAILAASPRLSMHGFLLALRRLSGLSYICRGVFDLSRFLLRVEFGAIATEELRKDWVVGLVDQAVMVCTGLTLMTAGVGRATHKLIARLWSPTALAPLAPLIGFGSKRGAMAPKKLVTDAVRTFEPVTLPGVVGHWASWAHYCVIQAERDGSAASASALERLWQQHAGPPPRAWVPSLCTNMALSEEEALAHHVVYLCRCRTLVVVWGPHLLDDLRCTALIWAWGALHGSMEDVRVLVDDEDAVLAALDVYNVAHVRSGGGQARGPVAKLVETVNRQLWHAVELVGFREWNRMVWALEKQIRSPQAAERMAAGHDEARERWPHPSHE